jgi:NADH-quinone oxidoreductase subunit L
MINPYIISVFAPLAGFLIIGVFGNVFGKRIANLVTCGLMAIALGASLLAFQDVIFGGHNHHFYLLNWIEVGQFKATWSLVFNPLTTVMVTTVNIVSFLVHIYSVGYMEHDPCVPRFMAYLSLFTFMMLMLVTADNLLQLYFGWEGVGLTSYLLIGFWYQKNSANAAAIKAFLVNRVGDISFALGIAAIFYVFNTIEFSAIFEHLHDATEETFVFLGYEFSCLEVIAFLLFIGAMGKSAQLGLHTWLPDAMEGPTPVSALIHAATMVTAGVFLVVRMSPVFELAPYAKSFVTIIGASTALFAGSVAITQNDIKRVIAYSTCSQLGYMFFAAGLSAYNLAIFHLITHAFFKALLFLGAGAVIHAMSDEQDMRYMGGIWRGIPVTYTMMWIGSLALAGIPYFSGYYSKDAILEMTWLTTGLDAQYAYLLGMGAVFLTALYSWRLIFMTFNGPAHADERVMGHLHEPNMTMLAPCIILCAGSIFAGYFGVSYALNPQFWRESIIMISPEHEVVIPMIVEYLPTITALVGIGLAYVFYLKFTQWPQKLAHAFRYLYAFLYQKWYFDQIYDFLFVRNAQFLGGIFWQKGDIDLIDGYGPDGMARRALKLASRASQIQSGFVYHYAIAFMIGFLGLVLWLAW